MSDSSSSLPTSPPSPLLFDVLTVYLRPLLDKHASHNPILVYEDLTASYHAVERFLQSRRGAQPGDGGREEEKEDRTVSGKVDEAAVRKHLTALHRGQVQAYRDAAIVALQDYAAQAPLLPLEDLHRAREAYVQACCDAILQQRPGWKVGTGILERNVASTVRQRAGDAYDQLAAKQQQNQQPPVQAPTKAANDEEDDGEVEEEDGEDGEMEEGEDVEDGEEGEVEESAPPLATETPAGTASTATADSKKQGPAKRKRSLLKAGKAALLRKAVKAPAAARPNTRLGSRRGRGGSNAVASK